MKTSARLLFGVRSSVEVTLTVTVSGSPLPLSLDLHILTTGVRDRAVPCNGTSWTVTLAAGEHVVYLPVPNEAWFREPLSFSLSAPATLVIPGERPDSLVSWTSDLGLAADPKNPLPPPHLNRRVDDPASASWLRDQLITILEGIALERTLAEATL